MVPYLIKTQPEVGICIGGFILKWVIAAIPILFSFPIKVRDRRSVQIGLFQRNPKRANLK